MEDLNLGPEILQKLLDRGFKNLESLSIASAKEISETIGIGEKRAQKIIDSARELLELTVIPADIWLERAAQRKKIITGSYGLDELLGGGIWTGAITELIGPYGCGKSQICFQICVNVQLPEDEGGCGGSAYFVDAEGTFAPERLVQMARGLNLEPKDVLSHVFVAKCYDTEHQVKLVKKAKDYFTDHNVKLLIIDSIATHFRAEYLGREMLPQRQQKIMEHAEVLQKYADAFDIAVVVTNQVIARIDEFFSGRLEPALGYAWGHRATHRIFIRKSRGTLRIARIFDSPSLPERECIFEITEKGIRDKE